MERSRSNKKDYNRAFIIAGLLLLSGTVLFGLLAGLQYVWPGVGRDVFSFEKLRPMHVSSAVFWIVTAAMGSVLSFLQEHNGQKLKHPALVKWQFLIFAVSFGVILLSYGFGIFGGREYWAFHPLLAVPIVAGWILFLVN